MGAVVLQAQETSPISNGEVDVKATMESIDAGAALVASNSDLDATQKANLEALYQRAKQSLQDAEKLSSQSAMYQEMADNAAKDTATVTRLLEEQRQPVAAVSSDLSVEAMSLRLSSAKAELAQAMAKATALAAEPPRRKKRLSEIPTEQTAAEQTLTEIRGQQSKPAPANESKLESQARQTLLQARLAETQRRAVALRQEQAAYLATTELLPQQILLADAQVKRLRAEIDQLQLALAAKQSSQAKEDERILLDTVKQVPEKLRPYAELNAKLAIDQQEIIKDTTEAAQRLTDIEEAISDVKADLTASAERVAALGLTEGLGMMLREHRKEYKALRDKYRPNHLLKQKLHQYQIDAFQLEDDADKLDKKMAATRKPSVDIQEKNIDWSALSTEDAAWVLMSHRRKLIADTLQAQNVLLQTMLTSDTQQRELLQVIDRFDAFVDRNLFWTRSSPPISLEELRQAPNVIQWFLQPANWQSAGSAMVATGESQPLRVILLLMVPLLLIFLRPRMRRIIQSEGESAMRYNAGYRTTLVTFAATATSAALWPAVFGVLSYLLMVNPATGPFARGVGAGFGGIAIFIASRELLKEACRSKGLAGAHFGWSENLRGHLRRHLRWYTLLGGLGVFLMITLHEHPDTIVRTLGSRITAIFLFLVTAAFHYVVLGPNSPMYIQVVKSNPESIIYRMRKLIWWTMVLLPLLFAALAVAGYIDTTLRLGGLLQYTFLVLVVVLLALGLISRALTLHKRNVARMRAKETRERMIARAGSGESAISETGIELEDEIATNLPALDQQTRQTAFTLACILGCIGLGYIWSDILPALEYFDGFELWNVGTGDTIEMVTLLDIFYCVIAVVALGFATRNLPNMLELLVLSRTTLDSGARYAVTTLLRYVVFIAGGLVVLQLLSIPYQQLGWFVAAASVGLGFGLQEIVANFISGIILLLERPVRVGDVVTIDGTTGAVSRIQMRATTVTSWDRKELVVPNKDLITQKLLNWSLSNVINRLTIEIGVEYGADPDLVRGILHRVVAENDDIMKDPAPLINLESFGDNALIFHIRFFLSKLDSRIEVTHQVNTAIAHALKEADISIPFPQRDVNFKLRDDQQPLPFTTTMPDNPPQDSDSTGGLESSK